MIRKSTVNDSTTALVGLILGLVGLALFVLCNTEAPIRP